MKNIQDMNIEKELDLLKDIRKVDAPPFLYTRIEQKIKNYKENYIGKKALAVSFAVLAIICIINISVVFNFITANSKSKPELIIETLNLVNLYTIYHE